MAVCVELHFIGELYHHKKFKSGNKLFLSSGKQLDLTNLSALPAVDFHVDVHTHAASLQRALIDVLQPQCRPTKTQLPRKGSMTMETWALVREKRAVRTQLAQLQQCQRRDRLTVFFAAWRHHQCYDQASVCAFDQLISMQDKLIARALADFRTLGRQVSQALRRDDVRFFQGLLSEGAEFLEPQEVRQFWRVVRRALPKFRQRKAHLPPARLEVLEHQMLPHLCNLEMGELIEPTDLVRDCHHRQLTIMQLLDHSVVPASSLPSLT
eukprot:s830_g7.t1